MTNGSHNVNVTNGNRNVAVGDFSKTKSSALCYAWFIWEKGYDGQTTLDWID